MNFMWPAYAATCKSLEKAGGYPVRTNTAVEDLGLGFRV